MFHEKVTASCPFENKPFTFLSFLDKLKKFQLNINKSLLGNISVPRRPYIGSFIKTFSMANRLWREVRWQEILTKNNKTKI